MKLFNLQLTAIDFILRGSLILLGIIYPFVIYHWIGPLPSISEYFMTPAQPVFLLINAGTSFYFVATKNWRIPGILLLILSCFSLEYYSSFHTIAAALFFVLSMFSVSIGKRYRFISLPILLSAFGLYHSIFLAEVLAIFFICIYHLLILYDIYSLQKKRNNTIQHYD